MPPSIVASASMAAALLAATALVSYSLWDIHSTQRKNRRLRQKLPKDLYSWRSPTTVEEFDELWKDLEEVLLKAGFLSWFQPISYIAFLRTPGNTYPVSNGYGYVASHRTDLRGPGTADKQRVFQYRNANNRVASTRDGHAVVIRVIVVHSDGHDHLKILRKIATGVNSLFSNNHVLPMFAEFQFEDIIFGIFPKVGSSMEDLYGFWARNSAGDIVETIMQMLEALSFIHKLNIAHRDAFKDNFLIQWMPESMKTMSISPSRPRVYLIDFEVAIVFPSESTVEERVVTGYPLGGTFPDLKDYSRPHAPEFATGKPYSPFKLDFWQLASSFSDFRSTIADIDQVLVDMRSDDPDQRPDAQEALDRIRTVVISMSPESLLIEPWTERGFMTEMAAKAEAQTENKEIGNCDSD